MTTRSRQLATALACITTLFLTHAPAESAAPAPDLAGKAWKARSESAAKKLASPGLDKCDKGVERAFQQPNEVTAGTKRSYELQIEIDKEEMVASYTYDGQRLTSFALLALPPGWLVVQKTDSRALNILVTGANCSFDLCPRDPLTTGPCTD